jgi:hypothetical protein
MVEELLFKLTTDANFICERIDQVFLDVRHIRGAIELCFVGNWRNFIVAVAGRAVSNYYRFRRRRRRLDTVSCLSPVIIRSHMKSISRRTVRRTGAIYITAVLEFVLSEILDLCIFLVSREKLTRILPRHIYIANNCNPYSQPLFRGVVPSAPYMTREEILQLREILGKRDKPAQHQLTLT